MSARYYCTENPEKHTEFRVPASVREWWLVDENGDWQETLDEPGDVLDGPFMEDAECVSDGCAGRVVYGIPPSPLTRLAEQAE